MWPSEIIVLFFLVPVFILVGYIIFIGIRFNMDPKKEDNNFKYLWDIYTRPDGLAKDIASDLAISPEDINSFDQSEFSTDPVASQLDNDAHVYALRAFCANNPDLKIDIQAQGCRYATKEACLANSSRTQNVSDMLSGKGKPFLRWQESGGIGCFRDLGNGNSCFDQCPKIERACTPKEEKELTALAKSAYEEEQKKQGKHALNGTFQDYLDRNPVKCYEDKEQIENDSTIKTASSLMADNASYGKCFDFTYVPPVIQCDPDGYCYTQQKNQVGRCILTKNYCLSKGMDYSSQGLGDCYETDAQSVTEGIFGKTLYRTYKKQFQNLTGNCTKKSPNDEGCASSAASIIFMPEVIAWDTAVASVTQQVTAIKNDCRLGGTDVDATSADSTGKAMNGPEVMKCINDFATVAFPGYFVLNKLNDFATSLIRLIPGGKNFPGLDLYGYQAMVQFGGQVLDGVFKFGSDMGKAFNEAGKDISKAYTALTKGDLVDFAVDATKTLVKVAVKLAEEIGKFTLSVIKAGAKAAETAILHGLEAVQIVFQGIAKGVDAMGTYIANHLANCGKGKTVNECMDEKFGTALGTIFGAYVEGFLAALKALKFVLDLVAEAAKWLEGALKSFFCFFFSC